MSTQSYKDFIRLFIRYFAVGLINTAVHWAVFLNCFYFFHTSQTLANFLAFCFSTTCNFFLNAKWTFNSPVTLVKYVSFIAFIGSLSLLMGYIADQLHLATLITLISFSGTCLICGFLFSKYIIFKDTNLKIPS